MATFRTTTITAEKRSSKRLSALSFSSITSFASSSASVAASEDNPIVVTTTVSTTSAPYPYPAPVPPPFTTSRGSDDVLPRPRHGAPVVAPAKSVEQRRKEQKRRCSRLSFVVGRKREALDPALCEGWWWVSVHFTVRRRLTCLLQKISALPQPREHACVRLLWGKLESERLALRTNPLCMSFSYSRWLNCLSLAAP
ncbi:hypothetical protein C8F04DRAFT_1331409 [Mycena alexandri]|uniref:Uncharacterized protein n=1 Tax=Mycena alexandri TaxID=1745969 RepID=A0AAD6RYE7_9AGAR|nr:hypothetical protein C8F04DRAFT_1331409 [Mycena alexandri]